LLGAALVGSRIFLRHCGTVTDETAKKYIDSQFDQIKGNFMKKTKMGSEPSLGFQPQTSVCLDRRPFQGA
jgi:hypothetical protein